MTLQPPFALFVLSESVDTEYLDSCLKRAWRGNFMAGWDFWLATDDYDDMPKKGGSGKATEGTRPPVSDSFSSPWLNKRIHDCAKWLQKAPEDVAVNTEYFTAITEHSQSDDSILVCQIVRLAGSGAFYVDYFPQHTDAFGMEMATNQGSKFLEKAQGYQARRRQEGKPDRSKIGHASWPGVMTKH